MNKELIMKSDVLDIIFEKRNKAYGAYTLRKFYHNRLIKSLGLMFAVVVVLSAFTFLPEKKKVTDRTFYDTRTAVILVPPDKRKEPEKPKALQPSKPPQIAPAFNTPVIVAEPLALTPVTTINDSAALNSTKAIPGSTPGDGPQTFPTTTSGPGAATLAPEPAKPVFDKTTAIANPEVMPQFPGGMDALHRFLEKNLNNPKDLEDGNMVSVKVQFVVGYDGKLQRFQIIQDGGEAFNNEVMRVLKKMPEWIPGRSNGENVSVYYTIPVKFVPAE